MLASRSAAIRVLPLIYYLFSLACVLFSSVAEAEEQLCNGRQDLCDRTFSEVAFAGTHNSFTAGFQIAAKNQNNDLMQQLSDGIRYVNFDVYLDEASQKLVLYHSLSSLGQVDFGETCLAVVAFLEANQNEVLVINMEDKANTAAIVATMNETGLAAYAHTYDASSPLTLREIISRGERLVVMRQNSNSCMESTAPECETPAWMMYTWALNKRTEWEFPTISDFNCNLARTDGEPFFMISHWMNPGALTTLLVGKESATIPANQWGVLQPRVQSCWTEAGIFPNFVVVDFYEHGHVLQVASWLNDNWNKSVAEVAAMGVVSLSSSSTPSTPNITTTPTTTTPQPLPSAASPVAHGTSGMLQAMGTVVAFFLSFVAGLLRNIWSRN
mmetsp:Transcript_22462/g.37546  ORF Transcript_22462/g.37546 Transcript_22462/m.37546 type:complete len:385 (-) Transcript_22462:102-1256(-)